MFGLKEVPCGTSVEESNSGVMFRQQVKQKSWYPDLGVATATPRVAGDLFAGAEIFLTALGSRKSKCCYTPVGTPANPKTVIALETLI